MADRRFLADSELEHLLNALPAVGAQMPIGMLDQMDAATRDAAGLNFGMAAAATAHGHRAFLATLPDDDSIRRRMIRPRLKMMFATMSAGVTHLCEHTNQVRPLLLSCDPPSLVCMDRVCLEKADLHARTAGFRWDGQCDLCGGPAETVFPYLTTLGPLSISGHLCEPCTGELQQGGRQVAPDFPAIARRSPCPCGSGRRYKACHGRNLSGVR